LGSVPWITNVHHIEHNRKRDRNCTRIRVLDPDRSVRDLKDDDEFIYDRIFSRESSRRG